MRTFCATVAVMICYAGGGLFGEGHVVAGLIIGGLASAVLGFLFAMTGRR